MNANEIKEILERHKRWIEKSEGWSENDRADLYGADLRGANLSGANLSGADLSGADAPYIPMVCPEEGEFIGWKKCKAHGNDKRGLIVKLHIPEDAKRSSSTGRKCRCEKAVVLEIQEIDGTKADCCAYSTYDQSFEYKVGETVSPKEAFNEDRWAECASGIHFFLNRREAVEYGA